MKSVHNISKRAFNSSAPSLAKVCVVGAAGGIGQPLSLLMKLNTKVTELALFDVVNSPGVAADISHISTASTVKGFIGADQMSEALKGADLVIIPAGVPRKPGMTRDDLFNTNASIVYGIAESCAKNCPNAWVGVISNPVNSTVPIFAEVLKKAGVYNPKKLFGVTTLDITRAKRFIGEIKGLDPKSVQVDVIGGHAGETIMPLLSQVKGVTFTQSEIESLTKRIQFGGDEVVAAKNGTGSATLSMAYAGAEFANWILDAMNGVTGVKMCTYVESKLTAAPFFASPVCLNRDGINQIHSFGTLSPYEQAILDKNLPTLISQAQKGVEFAKSK
jgi:malate dehydrogenase